MKRKAVQDSDKGDRSVPWAVKVVMTPRVIGVHAIKPIKDSHRHSVLRTSATSRCPAGTANAADRSSVRWTAELANSVSQGNPLRDGLCRRFDGCRRGRSHSGDGSQRFKVPRERSSSCWRAGDPGMNTSPSLSLGDRNVASLLQSGHILGKAGIAQLDRFTK